jgi:hypothetical protein
LPASSDLVINAQAHPTPYTYRDPPRTHPVNGCHHLHKHTSTPNLHLFYTYTHLGHTEYQLLTSPSPSFTPFFTHAYPHPTYYSYFTPYLHLCTATPYTPYSHLSSHLPLHATQTSILHLPSPNAHTIPPPNTPRSIPRPPHHIHTATPPATHPVNSMTPCRDQSCCLKDQSQGRCGCRSRVHAGSGDCQPALILLSTLKLTPHHIHTATPPVPILLMDVTISTNTPPHPTYTYSTPIPI